jgi:hypothetical protein
MVCIYEDRCDGKCTLSTDDDGEYNAQYAQQGCDSEGFCVTSEDPEPDASCDAYESDYQCNECGADLNVVDDCDCEE